LAKAQTTATLDCPCGSKIEVDGKRIGDSVECPSCRKLRVVIRSKVKGEVPPAGGAPREAISDRLTEVHASLERIRARRAGKGASDVALYPTWAIVIGGWLFGVFTGGYLAAQNMVALGKMTQARAARSVAWLALAHGGVFLLYLGWITNRFDLFSAHADASIPALDTALRALAFGYTAIVALVVPLFLAGGVAPLARTAREAGARGASPVIPLLIGFLLLVAQLFAIQFVLLATRF
jgi:hypothetical protein